MSDYPEHDKMHAISAQSQAIGEFTDWMVDEYKAQFCAWNDEFREYQPVYVSIKDLLAKFFDIDVVKLEDEKTAMLRAYTQNVQKKAHLTAEGKD